MLALTLPHLRDLNLSPVRLGLLFVIVASEKIQQLSSPTLRAGRQDVG